MMHPASHQEKKNPEKKMRAFRASIALRLKSYTTERGFHGK
jgi:hypothetical protein